MKKIEYIFVCVPVCVLRKKIISLFHSPNFEISQNKFLSFGILLSSMLPKCYDVYSFQSSLLFLILLILRILQTFSLPSEQFFLLIFFINLLLNSIYTVHYQLPYFFLHFFSWHFFYLCKV